MDSEIRLFVSHCAKDSEVAEALVELIKNALNLPASAIRCTSVDGYRLPGGANTEQQLRREVLSADVFIGLVSPDSIQSMFVAFELGARWGAQLHLLPILAPGVSASILDAPLSGINALRSDNNQQLHQIIDDLGSELNLRQSSIASYQRYIEKILQLSRMNTNVSINSGIQSSISFTSLIERLNQFPSEAAKINHIATCIDRLPHNSKFDVLFSLLGQFKSESRKLETIKLVLKLFQKPSEKEVYTMLSYFNSESMKHEAYKLVH